MAFSDVMRADEVVGVIYDVTLGIVQHETQTFPQNTVRVVFIL